MKYSSVHRKGYLFLWLSLCLGTGITLTINSPVTAQEQVFIERSEEIIGSTVDGKNVRKLIGDVKLKTADMAMTCDSAYQFLGAGQIQAFGNIQLETEDEIIWADELLHDLNKKQSTFSGRVIINTDSTTIFGRKLKYNHKTKVAHFPQGVRLEDNEGALIAERGTYYQKTDSSIFRGRVQIKDSTQYAEGDSLFANRASKRYQLYGNVFAEDQQEKTLLTTDFLQSDSAGTRKLRGNSYILKYQTEPNDTTHIWADDITYTELDTTYNIKAVENVETWSNQFSTISDTTRYIDSSETFKLRGNPKTWHNNLQLTGQYIQAKLKDGQIDTLISYPKPFVVQQDSVTERLNQIKGDTLIAGFQNGVIKNVKVFPKARMVRFIVDEENKPNGALRINTPSYIYLIFNNGDITRMKSAENTTGDYISESPEISEIRLEGFNWTPDLRPERPKIPPGTGRPPFPEEPPFTLPPKYLLWLDKSR